MGLFAKKDSKYKSSTKSSKCHHPNQSQYNQARHDGTIKIVAYCRDCGMEWSA